MSLLSRSAVQAARGYGLLAGGNTVSANYLVVAGGGGGGASSNAGGGGAGGMLTSVTTLSTLVTYSITVGAGGIGSSTANTSGSQGSNSLISGTGLVTITANGGGYGGHPAVIGGNGGSGGGSGYAYTASGGSGTAGQGNAGGRGAGSSTSPAYSAGGGGGAGGAGGNGTSSVGSGIGGAGLASSISGTSVTYAGGGAGGNDTTTVQAGGSGGGGNGAADNTTAATSGTANRGGGGGGGSSVITGGNGGSGIVIIAYTATSPKFVGGTITTSGGKQIHTFTSSGTLSPVTPITASYLVVAGGGGGGQGGGGAGGLLTSSTTLYSGASYIVTVGAGGTAGTNQAAGSNGSDSVVSGTGLTTITSTGGGRGGYFSAVSGASGGSGGGGGGSDAGGGVGSGGAGTSGQGYAGGSGVSINTTNGGGGGGGAGAAGGNAVASSYGGQGGVGVQSSISGTATYYAGGGSGGCSLTTTGGNGGGGSGGAASSNGTAGTTNTGGGGGGGGNTTGGKLGGAGGSGIVIISYAGSQAFNGGLVTTSGGNTIHTFTSSGALTPLTTNLNNSLRFRRSASAYLSRTPTVAGDRQKMTYSLWVKRGFVGSLTSDDYCPISAYTDANNLAVIYFNSSNSQSFDVFLKVAGTNYSVTTSQRFADPAAWYHIVVAIDTTQATAANRTKIYVNGNQVTAFITANYVPQNSNLALNNNVAQYFGTQYVSSSYFDGYMADINFIDGQALEPYYFGNNDANGVWKPIQYKGTYGTNGYYLPFTTNSTTAYAGYSTDVSSIFNTLPTGSQGSNFTFTGDFTIEGWVLFPAANGDQSFYVNSDGTNYLALNIDVSSGVYNIYCNSNSPTSSFSSGITVGNWTHVAMVRSGSIITLYTNGIAKGTLTTSSTLGFSSLSLNRFGGGSVGARYLSNVRITKSAVYTSNFVPPTSALTNIANTVVLTYQNSSAIDNSSNAYTIGTTGAVSYPSGNLIFNANVISDASGNANNWTPNNVNYSTTGTTYDAMKDVPTNTSATVANYCTLNPLYNSTSTISNANLRVATTLGTGGLVIGTIGGLTSGKYYWEATIDSQTFNPSNTTAVGIVRTLYGRSSDYLETVNGDIYFGNTASNGDIYGIAADFDSGSITFYKNNSSVNTQSFTANLGWFPGFSDEHGNQTVTLSVNFGQRPFAYTPPTGYVALNTYNLPTPTILQGNRYMDATLYTQNGAATNVIVNQGQFKPDLVWLKCRSNAGTWNNLVDSVRGGSKTVFSNSTSAELTDNFINTFNSNGFTLNIGDSGTNNTAGRTQVAWQWQAGQGTTSSNTSGSITSTVSVNTTAGFSIVTYTGTGSVATVGHGLGVAPRMIIAKGRGNVDNWPVYHASANASPATGHLLLNSTAAFTSTSTTWNNTAPTSTVFTVGTDTRINQNTIGYVAYCFAEIEGFSKFGSYIGNYNVNGTFVYCGFRPAWILIKCTTQVYEWELIDTRRSPYNGSSNYLQPNLSDAEYSTTSDIMDILSNGFKMRNNWTRLNDSSPTPFIYAAFAEHPFKNANAR